MKTTRGLFALLFSALLLGACNSKQWKETVETTIQLKSSSSHIQFGTQHSLSIDTLTLSVNSFSLAGNRIQAEDIFLVSDAQYTASQTGGTGTFNATFNIPQGTYESLQLTTELVGQNSFLLRGVYVGPLGVPKRVELNVESADFLITSILENGKETVSIDKNTPKIISISIDMNSLMADVGPGLWNAAVATGSGGQETIKISQMQNGNMYNAILGNFNESFNCKVE